MDELKIGTKLQIVQVQFETYFLLLKKGNKLK